MCETGVNLARKKKQKEREKCCQGYCSVLLWLKLLFCWHIVRYSIEWTFRLAGRILHWSLWKFYVSSVDVISKATGGSSVLMAAKPTPMSECTSMTEESDIDVDLLDSAPNWKCCRKKKRFALTTHVTWIPPDKRIQKDIRASVANLEDKTSSLESFGRLENTKHKKRVIEACSGYVLLKNEKLNQTFSTIERFYNSDPNEPRRHATDDAPPVGRVLAIYGINLPTEIGAVYKHYASVVEKNVTNYYTLDTNATLRSNVENGYVVEKGIVLETKSTVQPSLGDGCCSGDGTVPNYSLQHARTWGDSCNVTVKELPGAEHREILADERFHKILVDYVTSGNNHGIVRGDEAV